MCKVSRLGQLGWGWGKKQSGLDGGGRLGGSVGQMKGLSGAGLCMALIEFCVCGGGGVLWHCMDKKGGYVVMFSMVSNNLLGVIVCSSLR